MASWAKITDKVLADLFGSDPTFMPSKAMIRDAYPFGSRDHWPYTVWCQRVKRWKLARAAGRVAPVPLQPHRFPPKPKKPDPTQVSLI